MTKGLFDMSGKVTLVTGGNSGLGLGFAHALARQGGDLVIWGRRAGKNAEAAESLRQHGHRVLAQEVDVADEARVCSAMAEAVADMGRLDCVIANAGVNVARTDFHKLDSRTYHDLLAINQHGAFYTLREGAKHMVARAEAGDPGGSLIIDGSASVINGVPGIETYAAAKGALMTMMKSIAVGYGRYGVRANMICPGYMDTDLPGRDPAVVAFNAERMRNRSPIPRPGLPADLDGIIVYLASDASAYHTGDVMVIDGGLTAALW